MPCCGSVDNDQIDVFGGLDLPDLPKGEEIANSWGRGGHHVDGPGSCETSRDSIETMSTQVVNERFIWSDSSASEMPRSSIARGEEIHVFVGQLIKSEGSPKGRVAFKLDEEGVESAPSRRDTDGCPYRGLPDPTFPRDNQDSRCSKKVSGAHCVGGYR